MKIKFLFYCWVEYRANQSGNGVQTSEDFNCEYNPKLLCNSEGTVSAIELILKSVETLEILQNSEISDE